MSELILSTNTLPASLAKLLSSEKVKVLSFGSEVRLYPHNSVENNSSQPAVAPASQTIATWQDSTPLTTDF